MEYIIPLFIMLAISILIFWQQNQNTKNGSFFLLLAATSLDTLGFALTIYWSMSVMISSILISFIFTVGFFGLLIAKAVLIPQMVDQNSSIAFKILISFVFTFTALVLYSTGVFTVVNDAGYSAQERIALSAPAEALDTEIAMVRERISSLSTFADADKAYAEQVAVQQASDSQQARNIDLQSQLAQAREELSNCPQNHITKCIKPLKASVARFESELSGLNNNPSVVSGYAQRYEQYNGLQAHLVGLLKQRAKLAADGQGIKSIWKPEDIMIAWIFDIPEEKASQIKWLVFTFIFDFLSFMFRIIAAFMVRDLFLQYGTINSYLDGDIDDVIQDTDKDKVVCSDKDKVDLQKIITHYRNGIPITANEIRTKLKCGGSKASRLLQLYNRHYATKGNLSTTNTDAVKAT
jgi:hypothetical protein